MRSSRWRLALAVVLLLAAAAVLSAEGAAEPISANANRSPAGKLRDGVLTVRLEVRQGMWHPESDAGPGILVQAFAEEGRPPQIPGPLIRVPEGTEIRASVRNLLVGATAVVYGLNQRPGDEKQALEVPPGATREVHFKTGAAGAYYYWATTTGKTMEDRDGVDSQLAGAFIVDPPGAAVPDRVFVIGLWYDPGVPGDPLRKEREVLVINGKSWPHTEKLTYVAGNAVRWRWVNPSSSVHPMHLHGSYFRVDGAGNGQRDNLYEVRDRRTVVTEQMAVGGTMSMHWTPERVGRWLFHCHILAHMAPDPAASPAGTSHSGVDHTAGMAGLVLGITVLPGRTNAKVARPEAKPRNLRLLARELPATGEAPQAHVFQLQEGSEEPPREAAAIPGPPIVLRRDEPVHINVVNQMRQPTAVHWHGIELDAYYDGVPGWGGHSKQVTPPIEPGRSFVAKFTPPRAGTFIYHTHWHDVLQLSTGLYGPLIVLEPGRKFDPETDKILLISRDGPDDEKAPLLLNGRSQPPPLRFRVGVKYRLRLINITPNNSLITVSLLAGSSPASWRPIAKDGADLPPAQAVLQGARQVVGVGETYDFEFQPLARSDFLLEVLRPRNNQRVVAAVEVR